MEITNLPIAGYRANEYLLVLTPNEELVQKIRHIKEDCAGKYKLSYSRTMKPHITLVQYVQWEMMDEKIHHRLQTLSMGISPFKIEMKDYGSFPSHTVFINVLSKLPIQKMIRELKTVQQLMKLNREHKPHFMDEPFIPVCRNLKPWQYEQAWLEYSHRHFTGRFIADSMLLLKRSYSSKSAYQIAHRYEFLNLPVGTRQGTLFGG